MWDWFPLTDPDFMLSVLTCNSFSVWNDTGYCSKAYDNLYSRQSAAMDPAQRRQLLFNELGDANVLESDGIEHAGGGLDDARGCMSRHRLEGNTLGDKRTDALEGDDLFKFDAVAESAARGDDRVGQFDAGELHSHVGFHAL